MENDKKFKVILRNLMRDRGKSVLYAQSTHLQNLNLQESRNGHTLLHLLTINGKTDVAIALVERATAEQLQIKDIYDKDPIDLALDFKNERLLAAMEKVVGRDVIEEHRKGPVGREGESFEQLLHSCQWICPDRITQTRSAALGN